MDNDIPSDDSDSDLDNIPRKRQQNVSSDDSDSDLNDIPRKPMNGNENEYVSVKRDQGRFILICLYALNALTNGISFNEFI